MSEEKKKKPVKIKYELIQPKDIVDFWRLYENELKEAAPGYPSLSDETPEALRAHLFNMIASTNFIGVIARHGKKPVGQLTAMIHQRPFGSPRVYLHLGIYWVIKDYRAMKIGETLVKEMFSRAKASGIHDFEIMAEPHLSELFLKILKGKGKIVSHRISGKIVLE